MGMFNPNLPVVSAAEGAWKLSQRLLCRLGSALSLIAGIIAASAETLYDNGPADHPDPLEFSRGYEMTGWIDADDFVLNATARIESIKFSDLERVGNFNGSVLWRIYSNSASNKPGVVLASGIAMSFPRTVTGFESNANAEVENTFAIAPVSLPPGTYWLAMHNGPLSNGTNDDTHGRVYWEHSANLGARASQSDIGCGRFDPQHPCTTPLFAGNWESNYSDLNPRTETVFQLIGGFAPRVTAVSRSSGKATISFKTTDGRNYSVEYKDDLAETSWQSVSGAENVPGTGGVVDIDDPGAANRPRRFYHVVLL